jgi:hypothetical protein
MLASIMSPLSIRRMSSDMMARMSSDIVTPGLWNTIGTLARAPGQDVHRAVVTGREDLHRQCACWWPTGRSVWPWRSRRDQRRHHVDTTVHVVHREHAVRLTITSVGPAMFMYTPSDWQLAHREGVHELVLRDHRAAVGLGQSASTV